MIVVAFWTDAEILTTAFTAALFFNGNQTLARQYLAETGLIPAYVG
jgi:hypothetical protein